MRNNRPHITLVCTKEFKNKVLDHIAASEGRWFNQSHFMREAIVHYMEHTKQARPAIFNVKPINPIGGG